MLDLKIMRVINQELASKASSKIQPTRISTFFIMPDLGTKASGSRPPLLRASIVSIHLP